MSLFYLFVIALIQGLTEFLPISSSGHLILLPALSGADDQGQAIDVAVHVGTLGAVILYFRDDVRFAASGLPHLARRRTDTPEARLALALVIATIPVVLLGAIFTATGLTDVFRERPFLIIGWTMLGFGLVLYWADHTFPLRRRTADWRLRDAAIMGLWQAVALIPGTSRSGITITGGRVLGYTRQDATRLAMLMSIPTIAASGLILGAGVAADADAALARDAAIAAGLAFVSALGALWGMMRLLRYISFTPYVVYRVALGLILLIIAYS